MSSNIEKTSEKQEILGSLIKGYELLEEKLKRINKDINILNLGLNGGLSTKKGEK